MGQWHEEDRFWERTAPFQFAERRWTAAPEEVEKIVALLGLKPVADSASRASTGRPSF